MQIILVLVELKNLGRIPGRYLVLIEQPFDVIIAEICQLAMREKLQNRQKSLL